jgi:hypothetical protein
MSNELSGGVEFGLGVVMLACHSGRAVCFEWLGGDGVWKILAGQKTGLGKGAGFENRAG